MEKADNGEKIGGNVGNGKNHGNGTPVWHKNWKQFGEGLHMGERIWPGGFGSFGGGLSGSGKFSVGGRLLLLLADRRQTTGFQCNACLENIGKFELFF